MTVKKASSYFSLPENTQWVSVGTGHMNQTWIGGIDGQNRFILRAYNTVRTREDIEIEHRILKDLQGLMPVASPCLLKSENQSTIYSAANTFYASFKYIEGRAPNTFSLDEAAQAGHLLASCHVSLYRMAEDLGWVEQERPPLARKVDIPASDVLHKLTVLHGVRAVDPALLSLALIQNIQHRANICRLHVADFADAQHLIHGDFGLSNLLYNDTAKDFQAVLDWDECRWDAPVYDLCGLLDGVEGENLSNAVIQAYLSTLGASDHPYADKTNEITGLLPNVMYAKTYEELLTMLRTDAHELDYVNTLLKQLTMPEAM